VAARSAGQDCPERGERGQSIVQIDLSVTVDRSPVLPLPLPLPLPVVRLDGLRAEA